MIAAGVVALALAGLTAASPAPTPPFVAAVLASKPLAYFRLEGITGGSEVGSTSYSASGGVALSSDCAPIGVTGNNCLTLDGKDRYIPTTLRGGIATAGSIMAWIDLAALPSKAGHVFYIAGESQVANDFDVQIEPDDTLKFYTAAGSHVSYKPTAGSLVGTWHMIVATLDTTTKSRAIYWDGVLAAHDDDGGTPNKTQPFNIGNETTFGSRPFDGSIDEVAVWSRAIGAAQVTALYNARKAAP
jgi:hypothetical protein